MGRKKQDIRVRFFTKIEVNSNGCWEWTGAQFKGGYGSFYIETIGDKIVTKGAHRVSYEWEYGSIPDGLDIDHLCKNPPCVNPKHLEAVTHQENIRRGWEDKAHRMKDRKFTHCRRGHEFDTSNTYVDPRGRQRCRTCRKQHNN